MLCERCKIREANIQYTEVINGVKTEHNFCAQCAKELDFGQYSAIFDGEFSLGMLLSGLLGAQTPVQKQDRRQQIVCPVCGTSYEEFVKNSCFGCADCYSVFDILIHDNIKQLQGSDCHKGKRPVSEAEPGAVYEGSGNEDSGCEDLRTPDLRENPVKMSAGEQLRMLELQLKDALRKEEYETAAECRDRIRELKGEGKADA